jgi:hypothetical protein
VPKPGSECTFFSVARRFAKPGSETRVCETGVRVHFFSVGRIFVVPPDLEWSGWAGELRNRETRVRVHFSVRRIFTGPPDLEWSGRSRELGFDGGTKAI